MSGNHSESGNDPLELYKSGKCQTGAGQVSTQTLLIEYLIACTDVLVEMYTLCSILACSTCDVWYLMLIMLTVWTEIT